MHVRMCVNVLCVRASVHVRVCINVHMCMGSLCLRASVHVRVCINVHVYGILVCES